MAVCCQNLTLGRLSSRSALSLLVGALFKKFFILLNTPRMTNSKCCCQLSHTDTWEQRYSSILYLISALDGVGGQRHVPVALPPGKRCGTHFIAGWVGPRAGLDECGKSCLHRDSIPGPTIPQHYMNRDGYIRKIKTRKQIDVFKYCFVHRAIKFGTNYLQAYQPFSPVN